MSLYKRAKKVKVAEEKHGCIVGFDACKYKLISQYMWTFSLTYKKINK